ncbi:RluA family pseudouridine synthase [Spiroplasma chrysopicola]|uniref:Pseudouridine synthase n=1 Tax=Spiroplasma chrysopicola DF-1 TaxID=1276227 RepID=R4U1N2_9MOLU|nr:RluA family pseudouridine synthase [Spiroplasma chrysopicola]AGM25222.1 ribosomal large subunit pseudouridylate synthase D [Spiroplasma chrysopicola DF-1]
MKIISTSQMRLDKYLTEYFVTSAEPLSRTKIQTLIRTGFISVNNQQVSSNYQLQINDEIEVNTPEISANQELVGQVMDLKIMYQDDDLMIIDKPNGLVVHPAPGHYENTLVNGLLGLDVNWSTVSGELRPGIVHRIDRQTTGLLVVAKNDFTHQHLQKQIQNKTLHRRYRALVHGVISENRAKINAPIGRSSFDRKKMAVTGQNSKPAVTNILVIERFSDYTYIECELETGRTHQIRVHLQYINHPVYGDPTYGYLSDKKEPFGQYLHAYELELVHPRTGKIIKITSELPLEFSEKLASLREKE